MYQLLLALCCVLVCLHSASAGPSDLAKAKRAVAQIKRAEQELRRSVERMSEADRSKLKRGTRGLDSDGDGLADVLEPVLGANRCDSDSDDDGLDDDNDFDEDRSDSDGDEAPDGSEMEIKGLVRSFNDPELFIGSTILQITTSTVFFRGLASKAELVPGICVEAEGRRVGSANIVDKIKRHRGPACGSGRGGDDD